MERLAMAEGISEDNIYLVVKDIINIKKIPNRVKDVIGRYSQGMKIMDNGLPASGFLGRNGVKVTGIFKYGEITFISYVGKKEELEGQELIHLFSNVGEEDYDALKAMVEGKLKEEEDGREEL